MKHPILHLSYWLGFALLALIGTLSMQWSAVDGLPEVISLALSLSSLVLAIIAIIHTLTSQSAMSDVASQIRSSVVAAERAAQTAVSSTELLKQEIKEIPAALSTVGEKIERHTATVEALTAKAETAPLRTALPRGDAWPSMPYGMMCMALVCALSAKHGKEADLTDARLVSTLPDLFQGMMHGVSTLKLFDVTRGNASTWLAKANEKSKTADEIVALMYDTYKIANDETTKRVAAIYEYFSDASAPLRPLEDTGETKSSGS